MPSDAEYFALTEHVGLATLSDRAFVEMTGADRAKFLHNLCSNDIRRLEAGQGCEALLLNAKGKVVGHIFVYASDAALFLDSAPGQAKAIVAHLDRYIIREKVEVRDRAAEVSQLLLAGPQAAAMLKELGGAIPEESLGHLPAEIGGVPAFVRRSELTGANSFTVVCEIAGQAELGRTLQTAGAVVCSAAAVEAARIEAGMPLYGTDITEENLPQEIDRSDRAISFTKGCYLGQETVARIDALGHVNRTLVGLRFAGAAVPEPGCKLNAADAAVGHVTSAAYSPHFRQAVALGYVRQGHNQPGSQLTSEAGAAEVVLLPMRSPA